MLIGIDLGTTNCLAAYYEEGQPKLIPNRLGEYLTPSVISVDENNQLYVGATAKERMKELEYLKVLPKDQEINKKVIFRGERLYEESLGMVRMEIQELLLEFDAVLEGQDKKEIEATRKRLIKAFDEIENM